MKEWVTEDGRMPTPSAGALIRTKSDRWVLVTMISPGDPHIVEMYYVVLNDRGQVVITESSISAASSIPARDVKEMFKYLGQPGMITSSVSRSMPVDILRKIIRGDRGISNTAVWSNPDYLPKTKMTVAEIEKKLGYKIEIISEEN